MMKNKVKKLIKLARVGLSLNYPLAKWVENIRAGSRTRILTYHRIDDDPSDRLAVSPKEFHDQMELLKREGFTIISLEKLLERMHKGQMPKAKTIALTFDDGYLDNYVHALPILQKFGFTATFFLAAGFIDQDKMFSLSTTSTRPQPLSWKHVKEMSRAGMSFGAHTVNHPDLTQIPRADAKFEIKQSKEIIENQIGKPIYTFCYPGGHFNEFVRRQVIDAGYYGACSVRPGTNSNISDQFSLRRTEISGDDTLSDYRKKIYGGFDLQHKIWQLLLKIRKSIQTSSGVRNSDQHVLVNSPNHSRKYRIMHLIEDLEFGGAERQLVTIVKSTNPQKYSVAVCCLSNSGAMADELQQAGFTIHILGKCKGFDFKLLFKLTGLLLSRKIDILHTHIFTANFWGRLAALFVPGLSVVQHEHSHFTLQSGFRRLIERILVVKSNIIIAVSADLHKCFSRKIRDLHNKLKLIPNGSIVVDELSQVETTTQSRFYSKIKTVAIIGSLEPRKDHQTFLRAAKIVHERNPKTRFLVIGDGPLRSTLESQAKFLDFNGNLQFTGWQSDIPTLLKNIDVYVSSSLTEGISLALLEAMAANVPVVCTNVGGTPEIIKHGERGLLVKKQNSKELAKAITDIIENPKMGSRVAQRGREFVLQNFSAKRMISQVESIYSEICSN